MTPPADEPPRPRRSDATRAAILRAARERFGADGYERATIRAIAAEARIDPSMVMRYFGSKESLFAAAAVFDLRLPELASLPRARIGEVLVAHFLDRWEEDETMAALLRAAVTQPAAADRLRDIFTDQLVPALRTLVGGAPEDLAARAGMVAAQMLGLALTRYVLPLPAVAGMSREAIVRCVAPTIQRYVMGRPERAAG